MLTQVFDKIPSRYVVQFKISDVFGFERLADSSEIFIVSSDSCHKHPSEPDNSVTAAGPKVSKTRHNPIYHRRFSWSLVARNPRVMLSAWPAQSTGQFG